MLSNIPFVGPAYALRLNKLNISTPQDLLNHYPARYQDLTHSAIGTIVSSRNLYTRSGKTLQKIIIQTKTSNQELTFFNQPFLIKTLTPGTKISFVGNDYEIIKGQELIHTNRLVPVYPETAGVSSKWLRSRIYYLLNNQPLPNDWLPQSIKTKYQLINLDKALHQIHFPQNQTQIDQATKRLSFNELFLLQLEARERKKAWQKKSLSHQLSVNQEKVLKLIASLPFTLTAGQNRCLKEILTDLKKPVPMNRLLQGEVGSGKTVIAAIAGYVSYLNGLDTILMAPTEILANQHFQTLKTILKPVGLKIELITASQKPKKNLSANLYVGTHALLHRPLNLSKVGLVVIDEQHRFGVAQRAQLVAQSKLIPHLLTMTATPIPRTIALTLYSDLDLSVLDEMPEGRQTITTWVVPQTKRLSAYHWIESEILAHNSQAFIVCPLIEPSEKEALQDIKAVTQEFNQLNSIFNKLKLGLIHGRLKNKAKNDLLAKFQANKLNILVATPVIEVGIDIPNASIMVIENADRFGLAQLHQLRGRIGRNNQKSYCLIFTQNSNPKVLSRLKQLEILNQGQKLAELDLKLRGPGDLYGLKQHGFLQLKLASLTDQALISQVNQAVSSLKILPKQLTIHLYASSTKTENIIQTPRQTPRRD
ncbi:MAG: ATP-dependent DNA helicase RecG [Candidatus Beckwithbacteria bacterium]